MILAQSTNLKACQSFQHTQLFTIFSSSFFGQKGLEHIMVTSLVYQLEETHYHRIGLPGPTLRRWMPSCITSLIDTMGVVIWMNPKGINLICRSTTIGMIWRVGQNWPLYVTPLSGIFICLPSPIFIFWQNMSSMHPILLQNIRNWLLMHEKQEEKSSAI